MGRARQGDKYVTESSLKLSGVSGGAGGCYTCPLGCRGVEGREGVGREREAMEEREGGRGKKTMTVINREENRDRQIDDTHIQSNIYTQGYRKTETDRETGQQIDTQIEWQAHKKTDRQTDTKFTWRRCMGATRPPTRGQENHKNDGRGGGGGWRNKGEG